MNGKKKILVAGANPTEAGHLEYITKEIQAIHDLISEPFKRNYAEAVSAPLGTLNNIISTFLAQDKGKEAIFFHYSGHSTEEQIVLVDQGEPNQIPLKDFAQLLKDLTKVEIVFLNSCSSKNLGQELLDNSNIKAVIQTSANISDKKAAIFSYWFYCNLCKGVNLKNAFKNAKTSVSSESFSKVPGSLRDLDDAPTDSDGSEFEWELSIKGGCEAEIEGWQLIPKSKKEELEIFTGQKVLCLYTENGDYNKGIFSSIKNYFSLNTKVLVDSFVRLHPSERSIATIEKYDVILIFLCEKFNIGWSESKDMFIPFLNTKKLGFIRIKDDYRSSLAWLKEDGLSEPTPKIFPLAEDLPLSLVLLNKTTDTEIDTMVSIFCNKDIEEYIFPTSIVKILKEKIIDLNFVNQLGYFDPRKAGSDDKPVEELKTFNLLHIPGTQNCGQFILIRKFLDLADLNVSNIERLYKQLSEIEKGHSSTKILWAHVKMVISKKEQLSDLTKINKSKICWDIMRILKSQSLIVILDNFDQIITGDQDSDAILNEFWKEFKDIISDDDFSEIKGKFLLFIVSRDHCHQSKKTAKECLIDSDSDFLGKSLSSIELLSENALKTWHKHARKSLKDSAEFLNLRDEDPIQDKRKINEILGNKLIKNVSKSIFNHMKIHDTSFLSDITIH